MTALRILETPELKQPTLITAFAGWSDAGGAASSATRYLVDRWRAKLIADIDPEDFYDFTQLRPTVRYVDDTTRRIDWPENSFSLYQTPDRDLIIFNGIEPHLHWKAYAECVLQVIEQFKVELVIGLGSLFVEYPHTRPIRITGTSSDPVLAERAGLQIRAGRYEGPTGISGVLNVSIRERELPAATIWANVPHYVTASPNPQATLALLRALAAMLQIEVPVRRWERASESFVTQLNEAIEKNEEVAEYVRNLEEQLETESADGDGDLPAELPATESIMKDVEDFLRRASSEGS